MTRLKSILLTGAVLTASLTLGSANAEPGITVNGPSLDGQRVGLSALPPIAAPVGEELQDQYVPDGDGITLNGPALDGRDAEIPADTVIDGDPAGDEVRGLPDNGPSLDGSNWLILLGLLAGS